MHSQDPRFPVVEAPNHGPTNNSGGGRLIDVPAGVKGWSWGAFFFNGFWALFNKTWIGVLCFVPGLGLVIGFYLGFKGRELAWRNKRWKSVDHFQRVQRTWSAWAVAILGVLGLAIVAAIAIPAYQTYIQRAGGSQAAAHINLETP